MNTKILSLMATVVLSVIGAAALRAQAPAPRDQPAAGLAPVPLTETVYPNNVLVQTEPATVTQIDPTTGLPYTIYPGGAVHGVPKSVLVISAAGSDPKTQAALEEDLPVMLHLLNGAVAKKFGAAPNGRTAMGIDVVFAPGSSPIRSLYLDGYGALFLLHADFPLLPPPKKPEVQKEERRSDSAWEAARHEVYGQPTLEGRESVSPAEQYDEDKVNALKAGLLEALKSAANIRGLRPEDSITVCVSGGAVSRGHGRTVFGNNLSGQEKPDNALLGALNSINPAEEGAARVAILNIRVKKSDVDALAGGKMTAEDFRKRANVATYASQSGSLAANRPGYELNPQWRRY
jgi:hypothetical protein